MRLHYPVYIISKGRPDTRLTSRALEKMCVPYKIVVEAHEQDLYTKAIDSTKVLTLPFKNLGQGSIPARNWVWEHAINTGVKRHWILDDNIAGFRRFYRSRRIRVENGAPFRAAEDFVDRYENIALAGFQYTSFGVTELTRFINKPFLLNTRVYSCMLINNDIPYRWRGRYNEDTDLSLRALKDGWCTILFYAFLADKHATMSMAGGNTDELYQGDGRLQMAQSLEQQHPDVVSVSRKWGRWQHHVDYRPFRANKLVKKVGIRIPSGINNYGMTLVSDPKPL